MNTGRVGSGVGFGDGGNTGTCTVALLGYEHDSVIVQTMGCMLGMVVGATEPP